MPEELFSLLLPFNLNMSVAEFRKREQTEIMSITSRYMLGLSKYAVTKKELKRFDIHKQFSETLKTLSKQPIRYSRITFRKCARGEDVNIHSYDDWWIKRITLSKIDKRNIKVLRYPLEEVVLQSMLPTIKNRVFKLKNVFLKKKTFFSVNDVIQELSLKMLKTYRLYIHGVRTVLDEPAFYAILHNGIKTFLIDFLRTANAAKRNLGDSPMSLQDITIDDSEELVNFHPERNYAFRSVWAPEPEELFLLKEKLRCSSMSNRLRGALIADYASV
jgi:hypothetical protein